jgi:flagellin
VAADGRNIEVQFEPSGATNSVVFGQRIGMREGVQSATISLESKIQAPVVLSSSPTGDINRSGLISGNFSKNESVLNTKARAPVVASVAQVNSVKVSGTANLTDTFNVVINGTTFTTNATEAGGTSPQSLTDKMISLINEKSTLGVFATKGTVTGEILLQARTPGVAFTITSAASAGAGVGVVATDVTANGPAAFKNLGMSDLEINGIAIRPTSPHDDEYSISSVSSGDPGSSAIALAAAINDSVSLTGVKAFANPASINGSITSTETPISGKQSLYVNGIQIDVDFVQNESGTDRRAKVVAAINERTGQHGVVATDNGKGVSLSTDGRNLSVWFDASQDELSASDFGLDKGGSVAQVSKIKVAGNDTTGGKSSVMINGVKVETDFLATPSTPDGTATALAAAINKTTALKNVTAVASNDGSGTVLITSNVPGTAFDLRAPAVTNLSAQTLTLSTVTANSQGANDVSAIDMSDAYLKNVLGSSTAPLSAMNIKTVYGTVRMVSDAPVLPALPGADGLPPTSMNVLGKPIQIRAGSDGLGAMSNFMDLGFNEGSFGGRASVDMDPPRVGRMAFQVGSSANQVITIDLADFGKKGPITGEITGDVDLMVEQRTVRINTRDGATAVLNLLDESMNKVNATRATMGAVMNRLDHVINNLTNVSMNMSASRSSIEDADYASASTELAKTQIMQQAATAVLAQANTSQQSVMKLLGG